MIIPIGHEDSCTRRRPWVTIAVIVACLGAWIATLHARSQMEVLPPEHYREQARLFWEENPYLEIERELAVYMLEHEDPDALQGEEEFTRERWELWLLNKRLRSRSQLRDEGEAAAAGMNVLEMQDELDRLIAYGFYLEEDEIPPEGKRPSQRFGLIPAEWTWHGLVTHIFMHASWAHILGNLFLFFLAAPALEDRWGRPLFAVFYLSAGIFAGAFHTILSLDSLSPLVGASGAISGVLGAFLVLFWKSRIKFAYYFFPPLFGTFLLPAWVVLPLWFGNEMLSAGMSQADLLADNVAYWAHVGGFLAGALFAVTIRGLRLEERFISSSIERKVTRSRSGEMLKEARQALEDCNYEHAFLVLQQEALDQPDDGEIVLAFWEAAVAHFKPEEGAAPLLAWLHARANDKQARDAAETWARAVEISPALDLEPGVLLGLVPEMAKLGRKLHAALALRYVLSSEHDALPFGVLARARQLAHEVDPGTELSALRRLLAYPDLPEPKRARIQTELAELEGRGISDCPDPLAVARQLARGGVVDEDGAVPIELDEGDDQQSSVPLEDRGDAFATAVLEPAALDPSAQDSSAQDSSALDLPDQVDLALPPRFATTKCIEGAPISVRDDHLVVRTGEGQNARVNFGRIQGLGVAIVAGLASKPVLLIDLLFNWRDIDAEILQLVRIQSNHFDAMKLYPSAGEGVAAIRALVRQILERSDADPLPSRAELEGGRFARFENLAEYEQEVLKVERV
ncbi:MAG: rhomboid family intramembrane serine protease [Deltaproteobacteria bacterium]|nr:rhomboid family intramembrane serine protease [Deltaproteobacteria bacterium]